MSDGTDRRALTGRRTLRLALIGGGAGIAGCVAVSVIAHVLFQHFPVNPNSPDSWKFGAVFVGIIAAGVILILGFVPGWSRRHSARVAHAADAHAPPVDSRTRH